MSENIIEVKDLIFEYPDFRALHNVNFEIKKGTVTALVGPNGAGKTTLMRCIAALTVPLSGSIKVAGIDTTEDPRQVHQNIGYLSDFFGLYDTLTAKQSLLFTAYAKGVPENEILQRIDWVVNALKMEELLPKTPKGMSRGQRQKVAIAQSIIHYPKLVILDEPASGLDPEARMQLSKIIKELSNQNITVMVSSHILTELQDYSTDLLVIEKGRIVENKPLLAVANLDGKRYHLKLSAFVAPDDIIAILQTIPQISSIAHEDDYFYFTYSGSEEEQKGLLMELVKLNVPISELSEAKVNLQEEYLKSLKK